MEGIAVDELAPKSYEHDRMTAICEALKKENERLKGEVAKAHWLKEQAEQGQSEAQLVATRLSLKLGDAECLIAALEDEVLNKESQIEDLERRLRIVMEAKETIIPNPVVLRSMADEVVYTHGYIAVKLRQYAERIEGALMSPKEEGTTHA